MPLIRKSADSRLDGGQGNRGVVGFAEHDIGSPGLSVSVGGSARRANDHVRKAIAVDIARARDRNSGEVTRSDSADRKSTRLARTKAIQRDGGKRRFPENDV